MLASVHESWELQWRFGADVDRERRRVQLPLGDYTGAIGSGVHIADSLTSTRNGGFSPPSHTMLTEG
jgi:hypothetical protein